MAIKDKTNWNQVRRELANQDEVNRKSVVFMAKVGETAVKYARENGGYTDRSTNLRHSIGYLVVQNGQVMIDAFGTTEPQQMARTYAYQVARNYPRGTVLIWVAGMSYARYVETKGFDVLEGSGNYIESQARSLVREFEQYLLSA